MSKRKRRNGYSERISVGFMPEQMRRVEEILRVRARDEKEHKMIFYYLKKIKKKLTIAYGCVA